MKMAMFVTRFLPTLICLLVIIVLFYTVRVIDQMQGDIAAKQARIVSLSIGLLMAVGIPLYFKAPLAIGDYWTAPLIFFGGLISLNALRGLLKKKTLGWGLWCLGMALTLQFLLLQYGSHSAYDLLQPSIQTVIAKILIFLLIAIALPCLLLALGFGTAEKSGSAGTVSKAADSNEKLGQMTAFLGLLVAVVQLAGNLVDFLKVFLK